MSNCSRAIVNRFNATKMSDFQLNSSSLKKMGLTTNLFYKNWENIEAKTHIFFLIFYFGRLIQRVLQQNSWAIFLTNYSLDFAQNL